MQNAPDWVVQIMKDSLSCHLFHGGFLNVRDGHIDLCSMVIPENGALLNEAFLEHIQGDVGDGSRVKSKAPRIPSKIMEHPGSQVVFV